MEKSIAVVSFSKANAQLHKTIAETVIGEITHHYISLSGVRNVSSVELASKVQEFQTLILTKQIYNKYGEKYKHRFILTLCFFIILYSRSALFSWTRMRET